MTGCVAFGCSNRSENGFIMKAFPRDPTRRALWEAKVRRKNWKATNTSFLCEMHFSADQWEKPRVDGSRKLKLNAIPNIFSFPSKKPRKAAAVRKQSIITSENYKVSEVTVSFEQNTSNSEQSLVLYDDDDDKQEGKERKWCAAVSCEHEVTLQSEVLQFFKFPEDYEMCKKWAMHCHRTDLINISSNYLHNNYVLCSDHFNSSEFTDDDKKILKADAVPNIETNKPLFSQS